MDGSGSDSSILHHDCPAKHRPGRRLAIAAAVASCFAGTALANPANPQVVHGTAGFSQAGNILTVTNAPNTIINWGSFSINAGELTRFVQQSANSAVLNRVIGQDPSAILGALQSNGRVFLINPNGITFGAGAQIDVAGLVASTLRLSNEDFLAGRLRFTEGAIANSIINQGVINSGAVYLVGSAVSNEGLITSPRGEIVLAAGQSVELVSPATPHLRVEIVAPDNEARNLGTLSAEAGRIGIYAGLIRHEGTARADTAVLENGRIVLKATRQVELGAGSLLSAAAPAGGDGGFIETSAQNVSVAATARVTTQAASGNTGTWLVDPTDFSIAASGGNITGAALSGQLDSNNIVLATDAAGGGNGDIFVNDTVTWANANTLTLNAHRHIDFSGGGLLDGGSSGMIRLNAGLGGSSGSIVAHPSNTVVRGNTLVANALTGIGSLVHPLRTQVQSAAFSNTLTGGIVAANTGNVTVAARSTNGDIDIRTADGVNVASDAANRGGNITVASLSGVDGLTTTGSGNISLSGGAGGGTDGAGNFGGDGGSVTLDAVFTAAGVATLSGGAGGYAGPDVAFGGLGGSVVVNAGLNAAGVNLLAGQGGRASGIPSAGTGTGGAGGAVAVHALVNSSQTATLRAGNGGSGGQTNVGTGVGGSGGSVTINAGLTAMQVLGVYAGTGGDGNANSLGNGGSGGSGGSIAIGAALVSGQSLTLHAGSGGGAGLGSGSHGGAGGNVNGNSAGTVTAASAIEIRGGDGRNGQGSDSSVVEAGGNGGAGGSINLSGTVVGGGSLLSEAGSGGIGGNASNNFQGGVPAATGGSGGSGGSVTVGPVSVQGNVTLKAGRGGEGGFGGFSLVLPVTAAAIGGIGGMGGNGGSITVNGALTGQNVTLSAGAGASGGRGGNAARGGSSDPGIPVMTLGGAGGRGGDGGAVILNASVTAAGIAAVTAGQAGAGGRGGFASNATDSAIGGNGGFGGSGGAIHINAALTGEAGITLTGGIGGNGGSGGDFSEVETPLFGVGGNGGGAGEGGSVVLNAPVAASGTVSLVRGGGGAGGAPGSGSISGTNPGGPGAGGTVGTITGSGIDVTAASDLGITGEILPTSGDVSLKAGMGAGHQLAFGQSALSAGANMLTLQGYTISAPGALALTAGTVNLKSGAGITASATAARLNIENTASGNVVLSNSGHINMTGAASNVDTVHLVSTGGDVTLDAAIHAAGAGDAVRIAGARFVNNAGAAALSTPNGRWIVWSQTPVNNTFGGLQSGNTALWSTTYNGASPTVAETGNRYAFSLAQPAGQAIVRADDKSKTYGDQFTGFTFSAFDAGGGASYGNAFTDPGGTVTLTGTPLLASAGAADTATRTGGNGGGAAYDITVDLGGVTAPGFTLQGVSGLLTVNRRNVSVTADAKNLTYGDALQALSFTANNLAAFDNNATAFTGALSRTAGGTSTGGQENAGTYAIGQGTLAANANYTLTGFTGANYTIAPRALNVTATGQNKVYDGGTTAIVTLADNRLGGDSFTVQHGAAFGDKHVGTGKTVNVTGIALSGTDAGNYSANAATTATADITARALDVSFAGVNRSYDATVIATVTTADDRLAGDSLVINRSAAFPDKEVGAGKTVNVTGVSLSGADAGNYTVAATGNTTADIVPAVLTVRADDKSRLFNEPNPPLSSTVSGFVGGEGPGLLSGTLTLETTAMDGSLPGNYAITVTPTAFAAPNYTIQFVDGTLRVVPLDPPAGALNNLIVATGKQQQTDGGAAGFVFEAPAAGGGAAGCKTVSPGLEICF